MTSPLDHYLLRAYLDGEMDGTAAEAFEVLLMERPDLAALVEADAALASGLRAGGSQSGLAAATGNGENGKSTGAGATPLRKRPRAPLGRWLAAAGVVLAFGMGIGHWLPHAPDPMAPATLVYVDKMRSSVTTTPRLRLPSRGAAVLMVPVASADACASNRVRIVQDSLDQSAAVTPDEFGYANLVVDASRLRDGQAEVHVLCGDTPAAQYPVEFFR